MTSSETQLRATATEQAAEWFVLHRSGDLDLSGQASFQGWLAASPLHVEEYLGIARLAHELPVAAAIPEFAPSRVRERAAAAASGQSAELVSPAPRLQPRRAARAMSWSTVNIAAAVAAAGVALLWWDYQQPATTHFLTRHGEQQTWQLSDRSVVRLNTDSAVTVRFSRGRRAVDVERGQAYFEVAHEARRPFQVDADGVEVTAVGTKFDVYRDDRAVSVTVVEGRVEVSTGRQSLRAAPGEQVRAVPGMGSLDRSTVDLRRHMAWLQHQIDFQARPLAEVAREFNRYAAIPIVITAPALARLPVSGVFDADDTPSFVAFLRNLKGVSVEATATRINVRALPPSAPDYKKPEP